MQLYNPFRPHVVELHDGTYAVRRLGFAGWQYYDNQRYGYDDYWWTGRSAQRWAVVATLDQALDNLKTLNRQKLKPAKVIQ